MSTIPTGERVAYGIMAIIVVGMLIPLLWFPPSPPPTTPDERQQVILAATPVVDAIRQFKQDTGKAPNTLSTLVPKYLARLPEPPAGIISGKEYLYAIELQTWYLGIPLRGEHNGMITYSYKFEKDGSWTYFPSIP